jgi:chemotaxis protein CheX
MPNPEQLPAALNAAAAQPLLDLLKERLADNEPIILDGSAVLQLGQACLQVLLGARAAAGSREIAFTINNPSEALSTMANMAGCGELLVAGEA